MSRKSERLVNLTIALLATKRFLTKSEIFRNIEGYEGSEESKERMFERDKDDLRSLGIEIEVGGLDPLFNDEAGYRIKPESYSLNLGDLDGIDIALLSMAAQAWHGQALNSAAHSALVKLNSIGINSDVDSIPTLAPRMAWSSEELTVVLEAIAERRSIKFSYTNKELIVEIRTVQPYAVASRGGHWYFTGMDTSKSELRTFRFDRVHGQIEVDATALAYEIPEGFDLLKNFEQDMRISTAVLEVRQGKAFELRKMATAVEQLGEWDRITCEYIDESSFIDLVLWHLDDAVVLEPQALRDSIISSLNEILDMHG